MDSVFSLIKQHKRIIIISYLAILIIIFYYNSGDRDGYSIRQYQCENGSIVNFTKNDYLLCGVINPYNPNYNPYDREYKVNLSYSFV